MRNFNLDEYFQFLEQFWKMFPQAVKPRQKIIIHNAQI